MKLPNLFCTFILFGLVALRADEVTNWNLVATNAAFAAGQSPPVQTRTYAIVHVAIHDALNAIDRRNNPYALEMRAVQGASPTAAVAAAARDTLITLIPSQRESIEKAYSEALAGVSDGGAKSERCGNRPGSGRFDLEPAKHRMARMRRPHGRLVFFLDNIVRRRPQTLRR